MVGHRFQNFMETEILNLSFVPITEINRRTVTDYFRGKLLSVLV